MIDAEKENITAFNELNLEAHKRSWSFLGENLSNKNIDLETLINKVGDFQIAIPSWALGTGGTRFGRFPKGGEPKTLEDKIRDVGLLHALNQSSGAISLHIPWDIPNNYDKINSLANEFNIKFDAVNSNTFQDQPGSENSYKFGSLSHVDKSVRLDAINHNKEVIDHGKARFKSLNDLVGRWFLFSWTTKFQRCFSAYIGIPSRYIQSFTI